MIIEKIRNTLFSMENKKHKIFQSNIVSNIDKNTIIGIKTEELKKYAKILSCDRNINYFLESLPHYYFEENQLHAFIIMENKDFEKCIKNVNNFLPFINNWATCDQLSPKIFKLYKQELLTYIKIWLKSEHTYTIRFAIKMLMDYFLDKDFNIIYPKMILNIKTREYYVNMMKAWYFTTALSKQYNNIILYLQNYYLDIWTHNKTIQKAIESYRITEDKKTFLRTLKIT